MRPLITKYRLEIYREYNGSEGDFVRNANNGFRILNTHNFAHAWEALRNYLFDIELISKGLTSPDYSQRTIRSLRADADDEAFEEIMNQLPFYADYKSIVKLLERIKDTLNGQSDVVWTRFANPKELLKQMEHDIEELKMCNFTVLEKVKVDFGPTSTYQELSISNGWGDEFIRIADNFDNIHKRLTKITAK
jgi:hypothetical protein